MLTHLLDTSVYSQRLRPRPLKSVVGRWKMHGNATLAISACCEAELLFGLEKKGSERLRTEYVEYLKDRLTLIPFGYKEAGQYAKLRAHLSARGDPVADLDLMIAATAVANGLILATLNIKHFQKIPGLQVEDWSK
jgi:tRNA(fMet)-specific endonuclease VapC